MDRQGEIIMDSRTMEVLEFSKILSMLAAEAASSLGKELAMSLTPRAGLEEVQLLQRETTEARRAMEEAGEPPLGGIHDIRSSLGCAKAGAILDPRSLLDILSTIEGGARLKDYLEDLPEEFHALKKHGRKIMRFRELENKIRGAISENGEIPDSASPELRRIRAEIRSTEGRIRDRLDSMVRSTDTQRYLREPIVTMRDGRFVLPVRQEFKSQIPGIVHDQSASGATLFIEPMEVVALNNHLRELDGKERDEIDKILSELSTSVGGQAEDIGATVETLAQLDFIFARGRLSSRMAATPPSLNIGGHFNLVKARHPLLGKDAVPISPHLGRDFRTMVITGPNTGGKTVTLKTIGLLHMMAQAGLHVPASSGTEVSVWKRIFADIGDEQSIEQNLSTFSGHMVHISNILKEADENTLVLLDELGAGTDPAEGANLGRAILEYLHDKGCRTVATTHYGELKVFAYKTPGVINASTEFDEETLRPTFRLLVGVPGRSSAIAIARRLGLPERVTARAGELMGEEGVKQDSIISELLEDRRKAELLRQESEAMFSDASRTIESARRELTRARQERSEILEKARDEANRLLRKARLEAEQVIDELKSMRKQISSGGTAQHSLDDAVRRARENVKSLRQISDTIESEEGYEDLSQATASADAESLKPGALVFIPRFGKKGLVLRSPDDDGRVEIQVGVIRTSVLVSDLKVWRDDKIPRDMDTGGKQGAKMLDRVSLEKARTIPTELDLRGLTADEALLKLEKYLDDLLLAGLTKARIIHGKGTGALRQAVREKLKTLPHVTDFRFGEQGEGGDGVTVVTIG
ncbi:MAG TPA: endonuclease MutS2 [Firmicutes bacterium]|nr:endonuclease MutS2 [Bacillota bacterium]